MDNIQLEVEQLARAVEVQAARRDSKRGREIAGDGDVPRTGTDVVPREEEVMAEETAPEENNAPSESPS